MVKVFTNHNEFLNDMAEVIRLFLDVSEITEGTEAEANDSGDVFVSVLLEEGREWTTRALCRAEGKAESYEYIHHAIEGSEIVKKRYRKRCLKIALFRAMKKLFDGHLPWGSLTGIRPTRLLRELTVEKGEAEALRFMAEEFDVSAQKLELAREINSVQNAMMDNTLSDIDIYVGIPFCKTRCLYCSFASDVRTKKTDMAAYIEALKKDIAYGAEIVKNNGYNVRSLYMGGGTPTVLTEDELYDVLSFAKAQYGTFGREFTVEAGRPDTITREKLEIMHSFGCGRISINPQSMNQKTLELVGRSHSPESIIDTFRMAKEVGFECINMDVIAGLPGEDFEDFKHTLDEIAKLSPENLTVHTLAIKRSSRLKQQLEITPMTSAENAERMVTYGMLTARQLGMHPYYMYRQKYMRGNLENVGYAKKGTECIYNVDMMEETVSIMAHGAGSMNKRIFDAEQRVERIPNPKDIATYIAKVDAVAEEKRSLFGR